MVAPLCTIEGFASAILKDWSTPFECAVNPQERFLLMKVLMDFCVCEVLHYMLMSLHFLRPSPQLLGWSLSPLQQVGFSEFPSDDLEVTWLLSSRRLFCTTLSVFIFKYTLWVIADSY